ncbi:MFS transporter [Paenibacillus sp. FSL H8-0034]|uniref:MFS transporter n=1 Tax=Paenibacillus sp. FSL H8-0034 TaxID=2954671 RepID=UPI0030F53273
MSLRIVILIALSFQIMLFSTRPIMSLYALQLGASTWEIGMLTAAFAFFPFVLAVHIGKITDFIGDRLPVIFGMIGLTVGVALPFLFPHLWSLYVSQAIIGVSQIFGVISLQNVIGNISTKENRDHQFGLYSTAIASGGLIGPVLGGYLAELISYPFAYFVAACIGVLPICLSFLIPHVERKKKADTEKTGSSLQLLKIPLLRKALASSALVLYSRDIFVAYFPLFASQMGLSATDIGWIITIQGLTMVIVRFSLTRLSGKFGRGRVLLGSILVAGLSFLLVPLSSNAILFGVLSAFMGAGLGCGQPLSMTTTYNASPKDRTGEVLGLRLAINRLSQLVAPMMFGLLGTWAGVVSVFYVSGAFLIGGAFLTKQTTEEDFEEQKPASP